MGKSLPSANETKRLLAVRRYQILDTPPERPFDDLTRLAGRLCRTPMAALAFIDANRVWLKARVGIAAVEMSRDACLCSEVVEQRDLVIVPDVLADPRFAHLHQVAAAAGIRFCAAAPIITPDGFTIGLLCVAGDAPGSLDPDQGEDLRALAQQVIMQLELRRSTERLAEANERLRVDFDEFRRAEEERRRLDARIQQAQKLESLGVLAGGMAHDFNNLLMGVLGNAGLVMMKLAPNSPVLPHVQQIEKSALRLADLTNQMLAYSGRGRFVVQRVSLQQLVDDMAGLLATVVSKKASLVYEIDPNAPPVEADAAQIRQVLMNLAANASEALGDESGTITVRTGVIDADPAYLAEARVDGDLRPGRYSYVEVSDTGCGIDEPTRARIFDPFFTTKFVGRGLGLAAVHGIVRGHGGGIRVSSEPGHGSTFRVLFPSLAPAAEDEPAPTPPPALPPDHAERTGLVLVVDDEESVRSVAAAILRKGGFEVIEAADGGRAVRLFRERADDIALVLLDLTMPNMDGEEALAEIQLCRPGTPVILTSGYDEQRAMSRFTGKGLAGFIQKPYRPQALIERIRTVLDR